MTDFIVGHICLAFLCVLVHRSASGFPMTMEDVDKESSSSSNEKGPQHVVPSRPKSWWQRWWLVITAALMLFVLALALGLGLGLGLAPRDDGSGTDTIIDLGYSKYRGKAFSDGTSQWQGMRYAAAPVGQLRFAAPLNPPSTNQIQPAVVVSR